MRIPSSILLLILLFICMVCSQKQRNMANDVKKQLKEASLTKQSRIGPNKAKAAASKAAIEAWINGLIPERDYNATKWKLSHNGSPSKFFAHYNDRLSKIFKNNGAVVNFVLVGACDGTHDKTIADRFLKNSHWEGVFVEPVSLNFKDLTNYLTEKNVLNRSHLIKAAGTDVCMQPMTKIKFPIYETRSPNAPHWLRREIGAVLTPDEMAGKKKLPQNWNAEDVRCMTAADILDDWTNATKVAIAQGGQKRGGKRRKKENEGGHRRRPHVLKIDAEGHDYQVLMGFVKESVPVHELPLLISFEAKSIRLHFNATVAFLQSRGYVVSDRADDGQITNDGFAILKGDSIRERKKRKNAD